jgi:hypothetical protein
MEYAMTKRTPEAVRNFHIIGREVVQADTQKREAIRRRDRGGEPVHEIARSCNVSPATISRLTA